MMHQVISLCFSVQDKGLSFQYVKPCGHQKRTNKTIEIRLKLFNAPVFIKDENTDFVSFFPSLFLCVCQWFEMEFSWWTDAFVIYWQS